MRSRPKKKVRRKNATPVNDAYPFACANIDRLLVSEETILEIKTMNSPPAMRKLRGGEYFDRWYALMPHYLRADGEIKALPESGQCVNPDKWHDPPSFGYAVKY